MRKNWCAVLGLNQLISVQINTPEATAVDNTA
jgi:hypothetical protein